VDTCAGAHCEAVFFSRGPPANPETGLKRKKNKKKKTLSATGDPTGRTGRTMCDAEPTHEVASIHIMPPEMRCMIMNFVGPSLRDLAAAYIASPLLFFVDLRSLIVPWGAVHTYRLIKAGAPLDVVQAVVRERKDPLYRRIIKAAAYGGRLDVLRYLLDHGEVRRPFFPLFFLGGYVAASRVWTLFFFSFGFPLFLIDGPTGGGGLGDWDARSPSVISSLTMGRGTGADRQNP
jgi:hypothetical protein